MTSEPDWTVYIGPIDGLPADAQVQAWAAIGRRDFAEVERLLRAHDVPWTD